MRESRHAFSVAFHRSICLSAATRNGVFYMRILLFPHPIAPLPRSPLSRPPHPRQSGRYLLGTFNLDMFATTLARFSTDSCASKGFCLDISTCCRVSHLLVDLGWVDFDLGVPPSWPAAQPLLPNSHQARQTVER